MCITNVVVLSGMTTKLEYIGDFGVTMHVWRALILSPRAQEPTPYGQGSFSFLLLLGMLQSLPLSENQHPIHVQVPQNVYKNLCYYNDDGESLNEVHPATSTHCASCHPTGLLRAEEPV